MRGLIEGFKKSFRKISTGVENKVDESMSAIRFWTTPKSNLTHYLFIFKNTGPLGKKLNNAVCYRLVTMLYLEIQNWKEAMKASYFRHHIVGTAACTRRSMKDNK